MSLEAGMSLEALAARAANERQIEEAIEWLKPAAAKRREREREAYLQALFESQEAHRKKLAVAKAAYHRRRRASLRKTTLERVKGLPDEPRGVWLEFYPPFDPRLDNMKPLTNAYDL
jgi:hypothetical protein